MRFKNKLINEKAEQPGHFLPTYHHHYDQRRYHYYYYYYHFCLRKHGLLRRQQAAISSKLMTREPAAKNCLSKWRQTAETVSGEDVGLNPGTALLDGSHQPERQPGPQLQWSLGRGETFTIGDRLLQPASESPRSFMCICDVTKGTDTPPPPTDE